MRIAGRFDSANLSQFPGSNQICVTHGVYVKKTHRGKGLGGTAHRERLAMMKQLNYDYAITTITADNEVQKKILTRNGWTKLDSFVSSQTDHTVEIWGRKIEQQ